MCRRWSLYLALLAGCGPGATSGRDAGTDDGGIDTRDAARSDGDAAIETPALHVAPNGRDDWSGSIAEPAADGSDGPLATLTGARDRLRALRAESTRAPARVLIHEGDYPLRAAFVLEAQDSGEPDAPVVWQNAPGEHPRLSGGELLSGFTAEGGVWSLSRPEWREGAEGAWSFSQLYVNGRRSMRARAPNRAAYSETTSHAGYFQRLAARPEDDPQSMLRLEPAAMSILAALSPAELRDVELGTFDHWMAPRNYIESIDPSSGLVVLGGRFPWAPMTPPDVSRVELLNVANALDAPGEHYLDRSTGTLRYIPFPGEDPARAEVIAPRSDTPELIHLRGSREAPVHHIVIRGLVLEHSPFTLRRTWIDDAKFTGGMNDSQGIFSAPAALTIEHGRDITLDGVEIRRTGAHAIWVRGTSSERVTVHNSYFHDLGASGVTILEFDPEVAYELDRTNVGATIPIGGHHVVEDNVIHEGGRELYAANGVNVAMSANNIVRRNDIADFPWDGIQFALFRVNCVAPVRDDDSVHDNLVQQNRVHRIGLDLMSDLAGIYFFSGPQRGTIVSGNEVSIVRHHHVGWTPAGYIGAGIYLDGGSHGVTVENNVVFDTESVGLWMNAGRERVVRNNVFANVDEGGWGALPHECVNYPEAITRVENNVFVYRRGGGTYGSGWSPAEIDARRNSYWQSSGREVRFVDVWASITRTFAEWLALGMDEGSVATNPLFRAPEAHDYAPTADLSAIGFTPFELEAGVRESSTFAELADRYDGAVDFGGMYGEGPTSYGNPAYGGIAACPPGYTDSRVLGTGGVDYALGFCHRPLDPDRPPLLDFGGMFGTAEGAPTVNPLTGSSSCPNGYTATQVYGADGVDWALYLCHRAHVEGASPLLAGMYGGYYDAELGSTYWPNPASHNLASCPSESTPHTVLGTIGVDYPLVYCLVDDTLEITE
jgi:hypothetical protein